MGVHTGFIESSLSYKETGSTSASHPGPRPWGLRLDPYDVGMCGQAASPFVWLLPFHGCTRRPHMILGFFNMSKTEGLGSYCECWDSQQRTCNL